MVSQTIPAVCWRQVLDRFESKGHQETFPQGVLAITIVFGAGALPLKLHHALVGGTVGPVYLVSVAMRKPLFVLFVRRSMKTSPQAAQTKAASADTRFIKRLAHLTLLIGSAMLADAVLQTALALVLSASAFLIATTIIHIAAVVGIVLVTFLLFWIRYRSALGT